MLEQRADSDGFLPGIILGDTVEEAVERTDSDGFCCRKNSCG